MANFYLFGLDGAGVAARLSNFKKGWPNELILDLSPAGISKTKFEMPSYFNDESL